MTELSPFLSTSIVACTICGGAVDDLVIVLGSSVGFTGLAMGFELAFSKASKALGWQWASESDGPEDEREEPVAPSESRA